MLEYIPVLFSGFVATIDYCCLSNLFIFLQSNKKEEIMPLQIILPKHQDVYDLKHDARIDCIHLLSGLYEVHSEECGQPMREEHWHVLLALMRDEEKIKEVLFFHENHVLVERLCFNAYEYYGHKHRYDMNHRSTIKAWAEKYAFMIYKEKQLA